MRRSHYRIFASAVLAACAAWWVVFGVWLPGRLEESLREYFDDFDLSLGEVKVTWGAGVLREVRLEGEAFSAESEVTRFSYSPMEWLFGEECRLEDLSIEGMRIVPSEKEGGSEAFWEWLERCRVRDDLAELRLVEASGVLEVEEAVTPFRFRTERPNFAGLAVMEFALDGSGLVENVHGDLPFTLPEELSTTVSWERKGTGAEADLSLRLKFGGFASLVFSSGPEREGMTFFAGASEAPLLVAAGSRVRGEADFSGDWNATVTTSDLLKLWPAAALVSVSMEGGGDWSWEPRSGVVEASVALAAEASSFLLGIDETRVEGTGRARLDENGTLVVREGHVEVAADAGERLEARLENPWRVGRERAKVRALAEGVRLGRFSSDLPEDLAATGELTAEADEASVLARLSRLALQRKGEEWAVLSGLVETELEADPEGVTTGFSLKMEPGSVLLGELFPAGGFGEVFGGAGAEGLVELAGSWERGAFAVKSLSGELTTTQGERRLNWRNLRPVRFGFEGVRPVLLADEERDGEVVLLEARNLPLDGLLRWRGGAFQGDVFEGNGTLFFEQGRPGFRSESLEVENGRFLSGSDTLAENLTLRSGVKFVANAEGGGELTLEGMSLSAEGARVVEGGLTLRLSPFGKVTGGSSEGLEADLTALTRLGLPEFPRMESGALRAENLKVGETEAFLSLEVDASAKGVAVADKAGEAGRAFEAGLRFTAEESSRGLSTWLGLRVKGEAGEVGAEFDKPPGGPLVLSGDSLAPAELREFLLLFSPADGAGRPRRLDAMLNGLSREWRFRAGEATLWEGETLREVEGEANASSEGGFEVRLRGKREGAEVEASASVGWMDENATKPNLQNLSLRVEDWNATWPEGESPGRWSGALNVRASGVFYVGSGFVGEMNATAGAGLWRFLADGNASLRREALLGGLARVLAGEASLPPNKLQVLDRLGKAVSLARFDRGSLLAERAADGNVKVKDFSLSGENLKFRGVGTVGADGSLKLSLSAGVKGEWAEAFAAAGLLAEGQVFGDYRALRMDPLVLEGSFEKPDFSNFWRALAEGLGLEPE